MGEENLFKTASEARLKGLCDARCAVRGGFIVKKFAVGYKYFPLGERSPYLAEGNNMAELGEYEGTYYHLKNGIGLAVKGKEHKRGIVVPMRKQRQSQ